ncbi:MAG: hypothetical protein R2778_05855 [Saprospiraceae bacterium]
MLESRKLGNRYPQTGLFPTCEPASAPGSVMSSPSEIQPAGLAQFQANKPCLPSLGKRYQAVTPEITIDLAIGVSPA